MANLQDLISQVEDPALRDRLQEEADRLLRQKKFGLVFEEHLPECTPLYDVPDRIGGFVDPKAGYMKEIYRVLRMEGENVVCQAEDTDAQGCASVGTGAGRAAFAPTDAQGCASVGGATGCRAFPPTDEEKILPMNEVVSIARFGEAIYPCLKKIDAVENAPETSLWHTLIEADNYHALQLLEYLYYIAVCPIWLGDKIAYINVKSPAVRKPLHFEVAIVIIVPLML